MTNALIDREMTLDELLDDPLVALIMQSDKLSPQAVRHQMLSARNRAIARSRGRSKRALSPPTSQVAQ